MSENRKALLGFISLLLIGILLLLFVPKKEGQVVQQRRLVLDTYVSIKVVAPKPLAKKAINEAFGRMSRLEKKLNRYNPASEISKINQMTPRGVKVSADTYKAIELGIKYAKVTEGRFDITIGPLAGLFNFNKKAVPSDSQIIAAKEKVGWRLIRMNKESQTVSLAKKGMILDLGGLAKGYAADEAAKILKKYKISEGLIDTGSSTLTFSKADGRLWKVGLRHPRKDKIISVFKVKKASLSTSGDYQQYFIKSGKRYHHIINPLNGYPAKGLVSVTLIGRLPAADSDILSTAIFAMGPEKGYQFVKKIKNSQAVLIDTQGRVMISGKNITGVPNKISLK